MTQQRYDQDKTLVHFPEDSGSKPSALPFAAVAVAQGNPRPVNVPYIAQQTSFDEYTPGLNPIVNAAAFLLIEMIAVRQGKIDNIESLRQRLEAGVRSFAVQAKSMNISDAQCTAAQYLLCTALDESVTSSSNIPEADALWSQHSLLSTFHQETWGGEVFFKVLTRIFEQPAANLYLLELIYLLLSLGFEGKYKQEHRGPLELEVLRHNIYQQIRMLRGEPAPELSKKIEPRVSKNKIYAYVPRWLVVSVAVVCLGVTFFGFSSILEGRAGPLVGKYSGHAPMAAPHIPPMPATGGTASNPSIEQEMGR